MRYWVSAILSTGAAIGMLWVLWEVQGGLPEGFETHIIGAIVGTTIILFFAFSGNRYDDPRYEGNI